MMAMTHLQVQKDGVRLDTLVAETLGVSRSSASQLIKAGRVSQDGQPLKPSFIPSAGSRIQIEQPNPEAPRTQVGAPPLSIIYQDDRLLVIDKPSGIAVHTGAGERGRATLADALKDLVVDPESPDRPGIVHRLDKDTSGILVAARDPETKADLMAQWKNRETRKTYLTIVVGRLRPEEAVIRLPIGRDTKDPLRRTVIASGKPAETGYKVLAEAGGYSLVEANPKTGRTHQLRVHFAALGHPVAGDKLYGARGTPGMPGRQLLHASKLTLRHPERGEMTFESPLPPDMKHFWDELTKEYDTPDER